MCALNYQKPDRSMHLNHGRFAQNGRCGYVLKPVIFRNPQAFSQPLNPLLLSVQIISAFNLPHPNKKKYFGAFIEVELSGLTNQLYSTSVQPNNPLGDFYWGNETFEFDVFVPELEMLRFVAMDSHYRDKEIIGQYSLPVDSIQQGLRQVRLNKPQPFSKFEIIPNAYLLVRISIGVKTGESKDRNPSSVSSTPTTISRKQTPPFHQHQCFEPIIYPRYP